MVLTNKIIAQMTQDRMAGKTFQAIAFDYDLDVAAVRHLLSDVKVTKPSKPKGKRKTVKPRDVSPELQQALQDDRDNGYTAEAVAERNNVALNTVLTTTESMTMDELFEEWDRVRLRILDAPDKVVKKESDSDGFWAPRGQSFPLQHTLPVWKG